VNVGDRVFKQIGGDLSLGKGIGALEDVEMAVPGPRCLIVGRVKHLHA
jgi:hypothetical protein